MDKLALTRKIIARLAAELEAYAVSARAAHADATHEQSKAENKYDTRGLEASYLARGQSRQAAETEQARHQFEHLELRQFTAGEEIDLSALVEVTVGSERMCYFIGPRAGGMELEFGGKSVLILTPQSPLGAQLLGRKEGDKFKLNGGREEYRIVAVT